MGSWSYCPQPLSGLIEQKTLTYFIRGSITVQLTSCLFCLDLAALLLLNFKHIHLFGSIQTSQTGGQHTVIRFPYEVSECSLVCVLSG